jgi:uncharacterized membrane protein YfcA
MSTGTLVLAGLVVAVGAVVQGSVGFGMNLVAAPLLALLDPSLVPVPILLASTVPAGLSLLREHAHADWVGVGWAMLGRLPGTVLGVLAVAVLPLRGLTVVVALSVLACVGLSVISWRPRPEPRALATAGVVSGAFGTAASIGGPPVALLYQHSAGPTVRATMGAYFVLGSVLSVVGLSMAGEVATDDLRAAALLVPFLLVGFVLSRGTRRWLDGPWLRPAVLAVSAGGALLLIVRAL